MFLRWGRLHYGPCWGKSLSRGHGGSHHWGVSLLKLQDLVCGSVLTRAQPCHLTQELLPWRTIRPQLVSLGSVSTEPEALNETVLFQVRPWHSLALIVAQKKDPSLVNCFEAVGVLNQSYLLDLLLNLPHLFSSLVMCPRTSDLQHDVGGAAPFLP